MVQGNKLVIELSDETQNIFANLYSMIVSLQRRIEHLENRLEEDRRKQMVGPKIKINRSPG